MLDKLDKEFNLHKEVISSLPINNDKNKALYVKKIDEIIKRYEEEKRKVYEELESRLNPYFSLQDTSYLNLEQSINSFGKALKSVSNLNTPYEKLNLDKIVFLFSNFASEDFDQINYKLLSFIKIFETASINLSSNDFNYTNFTFEYMNVYFKYKDDIQNEEVKKAFEAIYWKCPNIVLQLELNLRYLYFKYEDKLKKYVSKTNKIMLSQFRDGEKNLIDDYSYLRGKLDNEKFNDRIGIIYKFVHDILNLDDYSDDKVNQIISSLVIDDKDDVFVSFKKLKNTLYEYHNYLRFSNLLEIIKKLYQEPLEKNFLENRFKKIRSFEKKLFKLSKKASNSNKKTKIDKFELEVENTVKEIKKIYDEIDDNMLKVVIKGNLQENSTVFKGLLLICQYYALLAKSLDDKSEEEINKVASELYYFVLNPNNNLINNLVLNDDTDLALVIVNNYRMFGINLNKDMLSESNLDNLMKNVDTIFISYQLKKLNISFQELKNINNFKKIKENMPH